MMMGLKLSSVVCEWYRIMQCGNYVTGMNLNYVNKWCLYTA